MAASDQYIDRLPPRDYSGPLALAYDAWMPPGVEFDDDPFYRRVVERSGGTGLELGTGNGRFLVPARQAGLDVEGIDESADMLDRCRRHADAAGLDVVLHLGDMARLDLPRRYAAIVCPAGSFTLLADPVVAADALASWYEHLEPGGTVAFSFHSSSPRDTTGFMWRLRRTGTAADTGLTYVVHESVGNDDTAEQVHLIFSRLEVYDGDGRQVDAWFYRLRLRWWSPDEVTAALAHVGFGDIRVRGEHPGWVVSARRP